MTILLLVLLAGNFSGLVHNVNHEISILKNADEKDEKSTEGKNEKEYISNDLLRNTEFTQVRSFGFYVCSLFLSPLLDLLKPPPDLIQ